MIKRLKRIPKAKYQDYFVLIARFLIGWTFMRYGYSKLSEGQFGLDAVEMATPVKDMSLFKLSWYLFDHQPFKAFIGVSQIVSGALLIFNRTALLGAFLFLPIVTTILLIDISFMPVNLASVFSWRLSFYILLDVFILWHYKERMQTIWKAAVENMNTKFKFPVWAYLILPIMAILLEIIGFLPKTIVYLFVDPESVWLGIKEAIRLIKELL